MHDWKEVAFSVGYGAGPESPEEEVRELQAEVHWLRKIEALVRADLTEVETALGHPWDAMRDLLGE
jgi:hypothetical protein